MKKTNLLALAAALAIGSAAAAQCTFVDGSLSTVNMRINSIDPSVNANHIVTVSAGGDIALSLTETGGGNYGFILLATGTLQCGSFAASTFVDQIDLGSVSLASVVLDGTNPFGGLGSPAFNALAVTPFSVTFALPLGFAGTTPLAFQALYIDPTAAPNLFFRATDAAAITFTATIETTYNPPDDGFNVHTLAGSTPALSFGGQSYNQFFINSNGSMTFAAGSDGWTPSMNGLFVGIPNEGVAAPNVSPNPGVAFFWADASRAGLPSGPPLYRVTESLVDGSTTIAGINQNYWNSSLGSGNFSCKFDPVAANIVLDYSQTITTNGGAADPFLIGLTDGSNASGTNVTLAVGGWANFLNGVYTAGGNNTSVGFLYAGGTVLGFTTLTIQDVGTYNWDVTVL